MKYVFAILMMLFTTTSFASKFDEISKDPAFTYLRDYGELISQQLPIIENRMRQIAPSLVDSVKDKTDFEKIMEYKNYLALETFDNYKNLFLYDMDLRSKETNRERKYAKYSESDSEEWWLDRGDLDTEKCIYKSNFSWANKNFSREAVEKELQGERDHTCFYPDGFEEYSVKIQNPEDLRPTWKGVDDKISELKINRDFVKENMRVSYDVSLIRNGDSNTLSLKIDVGYELMDYKKYYKWANQWRKDIKDGMYQYDASILKCDDYGCTLPISTLGKKWKSDKLPGFYFKSMSSDVFFSKSD